MGGGFVGVGVFVGGTPVVAMKGTKVAVGAAQVPVIPFPALASAGVAEAGPLPLPPPPFSPKIFGPSTAASSPPPTHNVTSANATSGKIIRRVLPAPGARPWAAGRLGHR